MAVRTVAVGALLAAFCLSACNDGARKHTETTQVRITGTPKAARDVPATSRAAETGVGRTPSTSQE